MKIGVISDTHIPQNSSKLPEELCSRLKECDLIVHAGDITELSVIEDLGRICATKAVYGNMDSMSVRSSLPKRLLLNIGSKKVGVIHGHGSAKHVIDYVKEEFSDEVDVVIFGHSHEPMCEEISGTLYVNPGSPTDQVFSPYRSFAIIEINGEDVKAKIIKL